MREVTRENKHTPDHSQQGHRAIPDTPYTHPFWTVGMLHTTAVSSWYKNCTPPPNPPQAFQLLGIISFMTAVMLSESRTVYTYVTYCHCHLFPICLNTATERARIELAQSCF